MCGFSDCRGDTKLSVFEGDIRECELLRRACSGAALVFHTASLVDVTGAIEYSELYGVNVKGETECIFLYEKNVLGPYL